MKFNCAYTKLVPIDKITPNELNPNKHPDKQIALLAKIIDYQGQRSPIIISNQSGKVVKGHGRLMALKQLGWSKAAVDYQDYESNEQEYLDLIADNKIAELSELDGLKIDLDIKSILGEDFDLELAGFPNIDVLSQSTGEFIDSVNKGDETSEWVGMPDFEEGGKYIKVVLHFNTELERELYCQKNNIVVDKKLNDQWIVKI